MWRDIKLDGGTQLGDLHKSRIIEWVKRMRGGESLSDTIRRYLGKDEYFTSVVLYNEQSVNTIVGSGPLPFDVYEKRFIYKEELLALFTFPQDYIFRNNNSHKIKYILGMSVMPFMSKYIAELIVKQWLSKI